MIPAEKVRFEKKKTEYICNTISVCAKPGMVKINQWIKLTGRTILPDCYKQFTNRLAIFRKDLFLQIERHFLKSNYSEDIQLDILSKLLNGCIVDTIPIGWENNDELMYIINFCFALKMEGEECLPDATEIQ